jgi:cytochrome c oxidase subunit III
MAEVVSVHAGHPHEADPVISHGDPTPPGKVAIWLFLASEVMFFIAILGTYIVLRSGSPSLFADHAAALDKRIGLINTLILILSSLTMALAVDASQKGKQQKTVVCLLLTFICAGAFLWIKIQGEYLVKYNHWTVVATDPSTKERFVYDGHLHESDANKMVLSGYRMKLPIDRAFNINLASERSVEEGASEDAKGKVEEAEYTIPINQISQRVNYMPWKNIFYSCYFALTGVHGLHIFGGMIPIGILTIQAMRGRLLPASTEYIGLYWHFVDLVWIFLFPLLYLV